MAPCPVQASVARATAPHSVTSQRLNVGACRLRSAAMTATVNEAIRTIQVNPTSVSISIICRMW
ncbi:hypothetical protein D3C78_1436730 [compost metagenome]